MRNQGSSQKRREEPDQPDGRRFLPFGAKHLGIQLGPSEEGEYDGAGARQKRDPLRFGSQCTAADQRADDQLGDSADHNLRESRRDPEPVGGEDRDQRQEKPESCDKPYLIHVWTSVYLCLVVCLGGMVAKHSYRETTVGVIGRLERR